ncbi:MAG: hypothetical protein NT068_00280 [Candidatus Nomurabacteria bacterium]|nr:hypothetical protein [Candidatus Nomurabacteria bacterium]
MKKYLLVFSLVFGFMFVFGSHSALAKQKLCYISPDGAGECESWTCEVGTCDVSVSGGCSQNGVTYTVDDEKISSSLESTTCDKWQKESEKKSMRITPFFIKEEIASPVPTITTGAPNKYMSLPYPFTIQGGYGTAPLPVNDPMINGSFPPSDINNDTPVEIDSAGKMLTNYRINTAVSRAIFWPPINMWTFMGLDPIMSTFKAFTDTNWQANAAASSKGYPLSILGLSNPAQLSPLIPYTIKWDAIPGAVAYHFRIYQSGNAFGLDSNLPYDATTGLYMIDIPSTTNRSQNFTLRGNVNYKWWAVPLDTSGNIIYGPEITSKGAGYTKNPYFKNIPGFNSATHPVTNYSNTINLGFTAGHTYFAEQGGASAWSSFEQNYTNYGPTNTFLYDGNYTGGKRPADPFIEWLRIKDAVKYEIQYANVDIPDGTPFVDGATFQYHDTQPPFGTQTVTTHVINLANCPNCGLHESNMNYTNTDDLMTDKPGFQFNFNGTTIPENNATVGHAGYNDGLHWRVRGIMANGLSIRKNISVGSEITPPLPPEPFQSWYPTWSKVSNATGYVIDVVNHVDPNTLENSSVTFGLFPNLDVPAPSTIQTRDGSIGADPTVSTNAFMLRKIVPQGTYNVSKVTTDKFKDLLNKYKVSFIESNLSLGVYDELYLDLPIEIYHMDWIHLDELELDYFNNNYDPNYLNQYYSNLTDDLGVTSITSPTPSSVKIVASRKFLIKNLSTGRAKITVVSSPDHKTNTITFGVNPGTGPGTYSFEIVKMIETQVPGNGIYPVVHPLTYGPFTMPLVGDGDLTNKIYTELDKLLPGTQYDYRTRCFTDPNAQALNVVPNRITFCPWSTVGTFVTPTGVPASITIQPTPSKLHATGTAALASSTNATFDTIPSTSTLKGIIKPMAKAKMQNNTDKIDVSKMSSAQLKASMEARQSLMQAYKDLIKVKSSKNPAAIKAAQDKFNTTAGAMKIPSAVKVSAVAPLTANVENSGVQIPTVISIVALLGIGGFMMFNYMKKRKQAHETTGIFGDDK